MRHRLRHFGQLLLRVEDSPHRTALAFGIGVFIAFFPMIGVHTAMALAIAFFFRLNRVALLLGAYVNNPWTVGPLFSLGTLIGCALTGVSPGDLRSLAWHPDSPAFYSEMLGLLRQFVWPFVFGNLTLGLIASVLSYAAVRGLLTRRSARNEIGSVIRNAATTDHS